MAVSSGFFNSRGGDRTYDAIQFGRMFDGLINDGVYNSYGGYFLVTARRGMTVNIASGRGWFDHSWILNDSVMIQEIDESDLILNRIDMICIQTAHAVGDRINTIEYVKGTPSLNPVRPTPVSTEDTKQYPLCFIYVAAGAESIVQDNITNTIGTDACPFVDGIIDKVTTSQLLLQWEAQFGTWFNEMKGQLSEDAAGHLQNEIDDIEEDVSALQTDMTAVQTQLGGYSFVYTTQAAKGHDSNTFYFCYQ